jgi:response regulator RpfG family c-di-GMP phosphodiesterase
VLAMDRSVESTPDNRQQTVLCVDDEENILSSLRRLLRREPYRLLTTTSGVEALDILSQNEVDIVISDQRMPDMSGTDFLKQVKTLYPDVTRIILTGYTDVDSITEAINEGHIYKFFLKPWNDSHLMLEIRQALEQHKLIKANAMLHATVVEQNQELQTVNENLERIVAQRTNALEIQNRALQLSHAVLENLPWPILGVGSDMTIVLANTAAQKTALADRPIHLGDPIGDYFSGSIEEQLAKHLKSEGAGQVTVCGKSGTAYDIGMISLSGSFIGQGLILILNRVGA